MELFKLTLLGNTLQFEFTYIYVAKRYVFNRTYFQPRQSTDASVSYIHISKFCYNDFVNVTRGFISTVKLVTLHKNGIELIKFNETWSGVCCDAKAKQYEQQAKHHNSLWATLLRMWRIGIKVIVSLW